MWHEEPDTIQFQNFNTTQTGTTTKTPTQPIQPQIGLYKSRAMINIDEKTPETYKELWAIILGSRAAISVCPQSFCPHVPIIPMAQEVKSEYITVAGEGLNINGLK
eukprot:5721673-Amphidinium_carterae.2